MASAGRLVSVLAHKLGTPLNVVAGRASLIQLATTDAEAKEHGEHIASSSSDRTIKVWDGTRDTSSDHL